MRDRLTSLKLFRALRNLLFCLAVVFAIEAAFLLVNFVTGSSSYLIPGVAFLVLAVLCAYFSLYFHGRFRSRE